MLNTLSGATVSLEDAVQEFLDLDDDRAMDRVPDVRRFNEVVSAVHRLCVALTGAELGGASRPALVRELESVRAIHGRSPFIARLQHWPRGYPGDFETIEYLWRGRNLASDNTSYYLEHYALTAPVAEQHRHKVRRQMELMLRALKGRGRIVNLACGSALDLRLAAQLAPERLGAASIVMNDFDANALDYCRAALGDVAGRCQFEAGHALRALRKPAEQADLILAGGLFDYLPERACRAIVRAAIRKLAPGGTFFFTNIAAGNPYRPWLEYCGEWTLIERNEAGLEAFCDDLDEPVQVTIERDTTGLTLMATLVRE